MARLPAIDPDKLAPEQRAVYDKIASSPRGGVRGPFLALIHAPEMCDRLQHLGEYLRYKTTFEPRLSEMAILIAARQYNCQYEWFAHEPHAKTAGLALPIIEAIRTQRRPDNMKADEAALYDYTQELVSKGKISDAAYKAAVDIFGTRGVVELAGIIGYYIMVGMTLLAHDLAMPPGTPAQF